MARESSGRLSLSSSTQRRSMRQPSRHKRDLHAVSCGLNRVRKTLNASNVSFAERERSGTARKRGGLTMTASGSTLHFARRNSRSPSSSLMSRQSGDWSPRTPRGRTVGHKTRPRQDSRPAARARVPAGGDTPLGGPVRSPAGVSETVSPGWPAPRSHRVLCAQRHSGEHSTSARRVPVTARGDLT
jgi:hypothetical protein